MCIMMGKLRETASFHRRLRSSEFFSKRIKFQQRKHDVNVQVRKIKEPCLVEIRNKHTKELVDIEVCMLSFIKHNSRVR